MRSKAAIRNTEQREAARELVAEIVQAFEGEFWAAKMQSGSATSLNRDVFAALAEYEGVFARPVPFRRDDLAERTSRAKATVAQALPRLIDHGLLTLSGSRVAPLAMLHLPAAAIEAFERWEEKQVAHARSNGIDYDGPELDATTALEVLRT